MENNIEKFLKRKAFDKIDTESITDYQIEQINNILKVYNSKTIKNRMNNIASFLKYNVDGDWLERLKLITSKLKNDIASLDACKIRYGDEWGPIIYKQNIEKFKVTEELYIRKYGEEEGKIKYKELCERKKAPWGLDACIKKYGKEEGPKKWDDMLAKKVNTMAERKKIKPYSNGRTLGEYQDRYGEIKGYKLWKARNDRQAYRCSEVYYIDTYGEDEGKVKYDNYKKNMCKTSLDSFIKRHGVDEGNRKYNAFVERLRYTHTIEYYYEKYGEIEGKRKYEEILLKRIVKFTEKYSKISQEMFWLVYDKLDKNEKIYFGELNDEFMFFVHEDWCKVMSVDFKMGNKIIEFDGDYWHSLTEQKIKDKQRDKYLKSKDYKILRIKECNYRENPGKVIKKCLKFLNNGK